MASATSYSIISGTNLIVSVLNQIDEPLTNLADAIPSLYEDGPEGTRKIGMFFTGFSTANADDKNVRVRVKLPEPLVVDADGSPTPKFGTATPMVLFAPASNHNNEYYGTARPVSFTSFSAPVFGPSRTLTEIDVSVDIATLPGVSIDIFMFIDFFFSGSR